MNIQHQKVYRIYFWHGFSEKVFKKIKDQFGDDFYLYPEFDDDNRYDDHDAQYRINADLNTFAEKYDRKFMVLRADDGIDTICVTQFNNFGQR